MNIRHDLAKSYEYNLLLAAFFESNKLNGITDCNIDVNLGLSVLSYYLEDYQKGIAQLNESIAIVQNTNKPLQLYDLYKRRAFFEIEARDFTTALRTIDTAEAIIKPLTNNESRLNHILAMRFVVQVNIGNYEEAIHFTNMVDANKLQDDNDDYFDYMNCLIKTNIHFRAYKAADDNINSYKALLKPWNIQRWRKLYEGKYLLAKQTNNYKEALYSYEKFRYYDDLIHRQKQNLVIMDQQVKYETKKKKSCCKWKLKPIAFTDG